MKLVGLAAGKQAGKTLHLWHVGAQQASKGLAGG